MQPNNVIYIIFLLFFFYFIILNIYYIGLTFIALFESKKRARENASEDYQHLAVSAFTLPVSFIIPAHNEEIWILDSLKSVLNQDYPEFEVIVVDDCSTDNTFKVLDEFLKLELIKKDSAERFSCGGEIDGIFISRTHPNVLVVSKVAGCKKAGAVNSALNLAKYKYVCSIDSDTILEPDALLKVMAQVEKDPDKIIGAGGYFGLVNGFKLKDGRIIEKSFSLNPLVAYQNVEYIRSLAVHRIAWSKYNAMPIVAGGFSIWRRDIFLELGGYSSDYSSEDLEFTLRAHDYIIEKKKEGYRILMLPYLVGWTEGPATLTSFIIQRDRWQRVTNEAVWKYRHMILRPSHKALAFLTLPYFLFYEVLGIFVELAAVALVIWGVFKGVLDVRIFLTYLVFMILCNTVLSLSALFIFVRDQAVLRARDVIYFIILIFLEFFWYRWLMAIAKLSGTVHYFKGVRTFDKYERLAR
ncbi:MAG: glycosyltransferase family 2 protein [Candidatus Omnitrophica bacterium]|nr:glycosyltransferase family 2 protein [Candidatus Omnitrophota bacterium]